MQIDRLIALALGLGALGCLLLAYEAIGRIAAARRGARTLANAIDRRATAAAAGAATATATAAAAAAGGLASTAAAALSGPVPQARYMTPPGPGQRRENAASQTAAKPPSTMAGRLAAWRARCGRAGTRWLDTPLGKQVVAAEDRRLIEQCGFVDANARGFFLLSRVACAFVAPPLATWLWGSRIPGAYRAAFVIAAFAVGFMVPKLLLGRRAAMRCGAVADEMPVFVDLLRLLQGVGLSLDQSLQVTINDFRAMLPVLASELEIAQRQFAAGRTREQSLQRLATSFDNEDLRAVVRLMIQVDRHGGAVQEPLKQFGDRLRETRRARLREKIGQLTVKMTGVMILTLLPALLIVTAGPGLLAVIRSLSVIHR
ncbi:type II secretion system F family protein [Trinickia dinghuensis]|uniref:Type II secretion system F family protein n=1 Tax=Trinickia dinghuensis TaxID=2291023 RepID=A0A3D8JWJ0_9BURK|nr:type II secretion system F family protein [Trinickia dinghuensis]RDU97478.1 type II secretion system F family protein [Trinickia dinghuensis]